MFVPCCVSRYLRIECAKQQLPETHDFAWQYYLRQLSKNLHVVITISPLHEKYQHWMRSYPAISVNCMVSWVDVWSDDALVQMGQHFLANVEDYIAEPFIARRISKLAKDAHHVAETEATLFVSEFGHQIHIIGKNFTDLVRLCSSNMEVQHGKLHDSQVRCM